MSDPHLQHHFKYFLNNNLQPKANYRAAFCATIKPGLKPVLTLWRRHKPACKNRGDRYYRRCRCAVWVEGTIESTYIRRSLKTRSWERGEELKRQLEDGSHPKEQPKGITIQDALDAFIKDCESRNLNRSTLGKYRRLQKTLNEFYGTSRLLELDVEGVRRFRETRKLSARTSSKELERLRAFFRFCQDNGWLQTNPAKSIKAPEVKPNPTLPFSELDLHKIFSSADFRTSVFFRVLLHSGLRIIDAAQLRPEKIVDGRLFLYTQKTGVPVMIPLPPDLLEDLRKLPLVGGYFFAVQSENPITIAEYYRVKLAKIDKSFHPHRFRDTFASNLLLKGVSIENVAVLLGNTVRVCERHYAPWIKSRQLALETAVQSTWTTHLVRVK